MNEYVFNVSRQGIVQTQRGIASLTKKRVQSTYGSGSSYYDEIMDTVYPNMVDRIEIMKWLEFSNQNTYLEVGMGTGKNMEYVPPEIQVFGTDFTEGMQQMAREKISNGKIVLHDPTFIKADTENLPFEEKKFDRLLACLTLCVTPSPESAMSEIFRVLKPGGRFVLYDMHIAQEPDIVEMQYDFVRPISMSTGYPLPSDQIPHGAIIWDPCRDLIKMACEAGLTLCHTKWFQPDNPIMCRVLASFTKE